VTLLTRGKSPVTFQIPDDTDASFKQYADSIKHIASDRKDEAAVKDKLGGGGFEGERLPCLAIIPRSRTTWEGAARCEPSPLYWLASPDLQFLGILSQKQCRREGEETR